MDINHPKTRSSWSRSIVLEGVIIAQLVLLTFFCFKAMSDLTPLRRAANTTSSDMRIATYNLRYDSMPDNVTVQESLASLADPLVAPRFLRLTGEQPWSTRRIKVAEHLLHSGVVIVSFQEALLRQVDDLQALLGEDWGWVGVGRDDGVAAGEFSPIFYKKSVIDLVSSDTFWLSDTPFEVSRFPGAGSLRMCTAGHFTMKAPKPINFTLFNTHLDDRSDAQRRLGVSLILTRARYEAYATRGPVLVTGDFNSPTTGADSGAYKISTGLLPPEPVNATFAAKYAVPAGELPGFVLQDLKSATPRFMVSGDFATYTGFNRPGDPSSYTRIDFVFGGSNGNWTADAYRVDTALTDDGILASDHRPVFVDLTISGPRRV